MPSKKLSPVFKAGDLVQGFIVLRAVPMSRMALVFYELKHERTGARYIHLANQDAENTFAVAFKTVPEDSTGVAHVLEHTALCGSKSYPVRDPFFSMIKRSINSFMNAFTASDWTMYPFSTCNRKDFYNLMQVYLDAAFFPLLAELSFKQEGFRVEREEPGGLGFSGVVYNEMKGAMSSPREIMSQSIESALYPDTTYGHNSGGDPEKIITLTHEQLKAFHHRHYHPANSFFYTYGNMPLENHLEMIDKKVLCHFDPLDPKTDVKSQPRWSLPKIISAPYPLAPGPDSKKKSQVAVAWLLCPVTDSFEVLTMVLLENILLGNSASPLRKALIESGYGAALSDNTGYSPENMDTMFSAGLKDVDKNDAKLIEALVFDTLKKLSQNSIDQNLIDAAIHQYEFEKKEVTNHPLPHGLKLVLSFSAAWFHHGDPTKQLDFDNDLNKIKNKVKAGPFFENKIREYLLDNPHRVLLNLYPDLKMADKQEIKEKEKLEIIEKSLLPADEEKILADAKALKKLQETEEDLSCLPTLGRKDIEPQVQTAAMDKDISKPGISAYVQPTNGILYFTAIAKTDCLPQNLIPLVPLFGHVFSKMGSKRRDYVELTRDIAAHTGGMGLSTSAHTRYDEAGTSLEFVSFDAKCLFRNTKKMFAIINELLFEPSFADLKRLNSLVKEYVAAYESSIVSNGHRYAISLCSRGYSRAKAIDEAWHGIHQLQTVKAIANDFKSKKGLRELAEKLEQISRLLFVRPGFEIGLFGEQNTVKTATGLASQIHSRLKPGDKCAEPAQPVLKIPALEAWTTSTSVSFVAHVFPTVRMAHAHAPALAIAAKIIRSLFIHREIREKGGAYGGFALSNAEEGLFGFASYRDPHVRRTIDVFSKALDFIGQGKFTEQDVTEAILQVCSDLDKPDAPSTMARKAFYRKLLGLSDQARRDYKKRVLAVTKDQVLEAAKKYFKKPDQLSPVVAVTSQSLLARANKKSDNPLVDFPIM